MFLPAFRAKIIAGRLPTHSRRLFDPPQRPSKSSQRDNLFPLFFAQNITHPTEAIMPRCG